MERNPAGNSGSVSVFRLQTDELNDITRQVIFDKYEMLVRLLMILIL